MTKKTCSCHTLNEIKNFKGIIDKTVTDIRLIVMS